MIKFPLKCVGSKLLYGRFMIVLQTERVGQEGGWVRWSHINRKRMIYFSVLWHNIILTVGVTMSMALGLLCCQ